MWSARAARARVLAERYPSSRDVLLFYAGLADWLQTASALTPQEMLPGLIELVERTGPVALRQANRSLEWGPWNFFGRICLQAVVAHGVTQCPGCDAPPQVGCLVPQADGRALELVCSLCLGRRPFPRGKCPACGEGRVTYYSAPPFEQLQLQACESCHVYLHLVDLTREPEAIPEVDELAGLPLDLWAQQQGYRKLFPNIAGI